MAPLLDPALGDKPHTAPGSAGACSELSGVEALVSWLPSTPPASSVPVSLVLVPGLLVSLGSILGWGWSCRFYHRQGTVQCL